MNTTLIKCMDDDCYLPAVWCYMPSPCAYFCDNHVPRGCQCNEEPKDDNWESIDADNWHEILDDQNRRWPCCEYMYNKNGFEDYGDEEE